MESFNLNNPGGQQPPMNPGGQPPPPGGAPQQSMNPADQAKNKQKPMKQPKEKKPKTPPGAGGKKPSLLPLLIILGILAIAGGGYYFWSTHQQEQPQVQFTPMKKNLKNKTGVAGKTGKTGTEATGTATGTPSIEKPGEKISAPGVERITPSMPEAKKSTPRGSEMTTSKELESKGVPKPPAKKAVPTKPAAMAAMPAPVAPKAKAKVTAKPKKATTVTIASGPSESYAPTGKRWKKAAATAPRKSRKTKARRRGDSEMVAYPFNVPAPAKGIYPSIKTPSFDRASAGYYDIYDWHPSGLPKGAPAPSGFMYPAPGEFRGPGRPTTPNASGLSVASEYSKVVVADSANPAEVDRIKRSLTRHNMIPEVHSYEVGGDVYYEVSIGHYTDRNMAYNKANEIAAEGFPARVVAEKVYH